MNRNEKITYPKPTKCKVVIRKMFRTEIIDIEKPLARLTKIKDRRFKLFQLGIKEEALLPILQKYKGL